MKILITNIALTGRTGTEIVTRNLALALRKTGHRPYVYSPHHGPIVEELRRNSIPVVSDIGEIDETFDILHTHHNPVAATAIARFPLTPAIFVCHDFVAWHDIPPALPSIRRYVGVDETVAGRLAACGIPEERLRIVLNAVDTDRFAAGPRLPDKPKRAIAFAKSLGHLEAIAAACRRRNIALETIGPAVGNVVAAPEKLLLECDVVFASAMSALEAMACGRSVVVCDARGMAGIATTRNVDVWRRANFGLRLLNEEVTAARIEQELDRYDPREAALVGTRIRAEANVDKWVAQWLDLYREIIQEGVSTADIESSPAALAKHLQSWSPRPDHAWPWMEERTRLIQERDGALARLYGFDGLLKAMVLAPSAMLTSGNSVRCVKGVPGHILYGPYMWLAPGRYSLKTHLDIGQIAEGRAHIVLEAVYADVVLARRDIIADRPESGTQRLDFEIPEEWRGLMTDPKYEFRIWSNGLADIEIHSLSLDRNSPDGSESHGPAMDD